MLSKILSLTIEHNVAFRGAYGPQVVNCFQKSYLWLLNTTFVHFSHKLSGLWIAFKNLIFDYWTQLYKNIKYLFPCCELLSKILSLTIEHNCPFWSPIFPRLWIAFKNLIFDYWTQPTLTGQWLHSVLWIAFKNLIFDYWTQLFLRIVRKGKSCELLSKILSLTIEHNPHFFFGMYSNVVNCFQKSYLWLLNTTHIFVISKCTMLWIAFKNLIFDYWTQRDFFTVAWIAGCELLSKILSLTIEHNILSLFASMTTVVNCFQKSYLWLLNTTKYSFVSNNQQLWIAFKNLIFDYWTQLSNLSLWKRKRCELLSKILSLTIEHNLHRNF